MTKQLLIFVLLFGAFLVLGCGEGDVNSIGITGGGSDGDTGATGGDTGATGGDTGTTGGNTGTTGGDTGFSGDTGDIDTDVEQCADAAFDIDINPINMLILLDRSRSMVLNEIGGVSFSKVVAEAINNLVVQNDEKDLVNFGLAAFPSIDCSCEDEDTNVANDVCTTEQFSCTPTTSAHNPLVEIGPDNSSDIAAKLANLGTCGGTPIADSISWVRDSYLPSLSADIAANDTYVLLATDGAPNCNLDPIPGVAECECTTEKVDGKCPNAIQCMDYSATCNAAAKLKSDGFKTFVIGVGNDVQDWKTVLDKMAEYGGTGTHYPAADSQSLADALENITGEAIECDFEVDWAKVPTHTENNIPVQKKCNKVRVLRVDEGAAPGETKNVPYSYNCSDPTGWRWKGLDEELDPKAEDTHDLSQCGVIELCSGICDELKGGKIDNVTATFGCGVVMPI